MSAVFVKTEPGQFLFDVAFSKKKTSYLQRKWKISISRNYRFLLRAIVRGDKKSERFWKQRWKAENLRKDEGR